jgi:hypothetical protein
MKCDANNTCSFNPLRYDPYKHDRNTFKNPVKYHEHGECPYRVDGACKCIKKQVARIRQLRDQAIKYWGFLEAIKGWKIVKENISFRDETFIRSIGGEITSFNNPKLGRTDWYVKLNDWKSGTLQDYLNGFVSRNLEYIGNISINYFDLVKRFDMIKITDKKIELFGELENFNDDSIFDWNTDEDVEFNTWFSKEFWINGKRVIVNIREVK